MLRMTGCGLSFLVLLSAAVFAFHRAQAPEYIGIDFVQFQVTGQHVVHGGDPRVYSDEVRAEILESAWRQARAEGSSGKFFHAVNFRHERLWETYSSPFLYAVFGALGSKDWRQNAETTESQAAPSSGLRPPYPPNSGEKGKSEAYEVEINWYWVVCLGATMVGFMTFGWVLRIPCSAMLFGSVVLVWFSPLRIDMNVANVNQIQFGMVGVLAAILGGEWKGLGWTRWRSKRESADLEAHHAERDGDMGRELVAGIWLGLCLAFKPSLLWCGVMWAGSMIADGWRCSGSPRAKHGTGATRSFAAYWGQRLLPAATGGAIGGILAIALASIWFPLHSWIEWIRAVRSLPDNIIQTHQGNFSPTYFARSHHMPGWLLSIAGPVMAVAVIGCQGARPEERSGCAGTNIARWLAIGCQIQLLTSNLVWYHYFILSIPAMLVVLREVSAVTGRFDKCIIGAIAVWCLLLLGLEPIDELLQSPPNEHMWRCMLANLMLIVLLVSFAALRRNHSNNWLCSHRG